MLHFKRNHILASLQPHKQTSSSLVHLEPAEVLSVLRVAKTKGAREWSMIVVAYKHGMRASEVCNLRLDDIDIKNGSIVVERLKGRCCLRNGSAHVHHPGKMQTIPNGATFKTNR